MPKERLCACGCGQRLENRHARVKYVDERHRQRAYRSEVRRRAEAAGLPASLSLKTVEVADGSGVRNGDAERGAREATARFWGGLRTLHKRRPARRGWKPRIAA